MKYCKDCIHKDTMGGCSKGETKVGPTTCKHHMTKKDVILHDLKKMALVIKEKCPKCVVVEFMDTLYKDIEEVLHEKNYD